MEDQDDMGGGGIKNISLVIHRFKATNPKHQGIHRKILLAKFAKEGKQLVAGLIMLVAYKETSRREKTFRKTLSRIRDLIWI